MKRRSEPGQRAIRSGWLSFTFGKTRTALNGGGGSGEPTIFEVVHGFRGGAAFASGFFGSSAGARAHATLASMTSGMMKARRIMESPRNKKARTSVPQV